jgi:quercetin dioxygenase-like cupin family protein
MKLSHIETSFEDRRGKIIDILSHETMNAATIITFNDGAIRGNHYHNHTVQWNYIISGRIRAIVENNEHERDEIILNPGDLLKITEGEKHAFKSLEDSVMLVFSQGPRGGKEYETDTFRLSDPLIL